MAGLGRKEWSPGDVLTAADVNGYLMDQSVMVFAGTAARASAIPSPSAGMVAYSTATSLQVYDGSAWVNVSTGYGVATGGASTAITVGGTAYTLLTFTTDSNLVVSSSGLFDICLVGGGGGGGSSLSGFNTGGGGGGGGIVIQTVYLDAATFAIDIGAGGTGATTSAAGTNGAGSSINNTARSFSTIGGGYGAWTNAGVANVVGYSGSSGGGGGGGGAAYTAGLVSLFPTVLGFTGGNGTTPSNQSAGGGGGATAVGVAAVTTTAGAGGAGYDVSAFIGGSTLFKAGGGGGGAPTGGVAGAGGSGVGGAGTLTGAGNSAAANTGGGGGGAGAGASSNGGAGGSGIVYVRFRA